LKARLLDLPLVTLLGEVRESVPIYGSGGFTSYSDEQHERQFCGWVEKGISRVKMNVGREPANDPRRVEKARAAIGPNTELFVDANGAYSRKQALNLAEKFADLDVSWFEEPVSSDDLEDLRLLRDRGPAGMDIAAGEYGYERRIFSTTVFGWSLSYALRKGQWLSPACGFSPCPLCRFFRSGMRHASFDA
jgi:L-alanine-DL-glutamate epimerase-like enolase superfamily enzyme